MAQWAIRWVTPLTVLFSLIGIAVVWGMVTSLHRMHLDEKRQVWQVTSLNAQGVVDKQGRLHTHLELTVDLGDADAHGIWIALPTASQLEGSPNTFRVYGYDEIRASSPSGAQLT